MLFFQEGLFVASRFDRVLDQQTVGQLIQALQTKLQSKLPGIKEIENKFSGAL